MRWRSSLVACSTTSSSATARAYRSQNVDFFDMWSGPFERESSPRGKSQENSTYLQIFLSQPMRSVPSSSQPATGRWRDGIGKHYGERPSLQVDVRSCVVAGGRATEPKPPGRSLPSRPNDLWCADYKGEFMLADRRYS